MYIKMSSVIKIDMNLADRLWDRAAGIPGCDTKMWRWGPYGEVMKYDQYNKLELPYNWTVGELTVVRYAEPVPGATTLNMQATRGNPDEKIQKLISQGYSYMTLRIDSGRVYKTFMHSFPAEIPPDEAFQTMQLRDELIKKQY
jgi:hypothetical protein